MPAAYGYTRDMRILGLLISSARLLFGVAFIARPTLLDRAWIGKQARLPGAQLLARAVGARDLVLGLGGLQALTRSDGSARPWLAGAAISDAIDVGATWTAGRSIPRQARNGVLAIGGVSSVLSAIAAAGIARSSHAEPLEPGAHGLAEDVVPSEPVRTA